MTEDGHVAAFLRDADRDRYFATLLLKPGQREAVQALYAYSADVASIRDRAREAAAGEIRVQWWIDAIKGEGHGNVRGNPLTAALLDTIASHRLPIAPIVRLADARRFDLYHDAMPDLASFEGYAGETTSALYQLAALIVDPAEAAGAADAAGHFGVAQALSGHLRALGYNAARGRLFLPLSVFAANGATLEDILGGRATDGVIAARNQLIELTQEHAAKARLAARRLPRSLQPIFAALALLPAQVARLQSTRMAPFSAPPEIADWRKLAAMAWLSWRGP